MGIILYGTDLSAHTHRVRLLLRALDQNYQFEMTQPEQRSEAWFLALNPHGQVPVLVDEDRIIPDSQAALVYLAKAYDQGETWLPGTPDAAARVQRWLSIAAGEIAYGPALARNIKQFGGDYDERQALAVSYRILSFMNAHLEERHWLAALPGEAVPPTIADLACYGYVRLAPEGGIDLSDYPNILVWLQLVEHLDGFLTLPSLL